jgi:hypothetical protein
MIAGALGMRPVKKTQEAIMSDSLKIKEAKGLFLLIQTSKNKRNKRDGKPKRHQGIHRPLLVGAYNLYNTST